MLETYILVFTMQDMEELSQLIQALTGWFDIYDLLLATIANQKLWQRHIQTMLFITEAYKYRDILDT